MDDHTVASVTAAGKIPVTVLTGFLGAGKTTLLAKLLTRPGMNKVAVIINEIGEIGIDHDLVALSSENISLLSNGCLCCTVRTDLQETLRELFTRRRSGQVFDFDRVLLETTGLADPAPIVQTFSSDTLIGAQYRLDGLVTLIDAVNAAGQLDREPEAVKQAAIADRLLITKTDLVDSAKLEALRERLTALNQQAAVREIRMGDVEPEFILGLGLPSAGADETALERFLGSIETPPAQLRSTGSGERTPVNHWEPDHRHPGGRYLGDRLPSRHDAGIRSFWLRFDAPFTWPVFSATIDLLTALRGPDLLRVKGIVNVDGAPVVMQGVQHLFHPPVSLGDWPSEDRSTRLVFITRRIEATTVRDLFAAAGAVAKTA